MFNFLISNLDIIIPIAIILLGIISVVCEKNKYQKKINNIQTYNNSIRSYLSGDNKQLEFLMTKGGEIEPIVQDYVSSPVTSFVHMLYKPYNRDSLEKEALNIHRISNQKIEEFKKRGIELDDGAFGENIIIEGYDLKALPLGTRFKIGDVCLELTQIGKECHAHCAIYHAVGDCIMPREGVFTKVITGGRITAGDTVELIPPAGS
jgi:hypothetical protein